MFQLRGSMTSNSKVHDVGIGKIGLAVSPDILKTILGSCVAICLFDKQLKIAGLAHIMLPHYTGMHEEKSRYADTGFDILLNMLTKEGVQSSNLVARIAGGAHMHGMPPGTQLAKISSENVQAVRDRLKEHRIPLLTEVVGGTKGRVVRFYAETGEIEVHELNPVDSKGR